MSNRDASEWRVVVGVALVGAVIGGGCVTNAGPGERVPAGDTLQGQDVSATDGVTLQGEERRGSPGADIHFIMSDTHCDGQSDDFARSCLPPGDSLALTRTFVVQP